MEINVNPFSKTSIEKAIKALEEYRQSLDEAQGGINEAIAGKIAEIAQENATPVYENDELLTTPIRVEDGAVIAGGDSYWVEFGTGIVGENEPHPSSEWMSELPPPYNVGYDTGKYIIKGDTPHPDTGYPHYWFYDNGQYVTSGIPSQHFLYDAVQEVIEEIPGIVEGVLSGE